MLLLFSHQVVSDSLQPHGLLGTRLPCPTPSLKVCPSSCPLHRWCHSTISSSISLFFCLQSFSASESFPVNWQFTSGEQCIRTHNFFLFPLVSNFPYTQRYAGKKKKKSVFLCTYFSFTFLIWRIHVTQFSHNEMHNTACCKFHITNGFSLTVFTDFFAEFLYP